MSERSKRLRDAIPESERAGTHMPPNAEPITGYNHKREEVEHGRYDHATRTFQGGGELGEVANLWRDPPLLSLLYDVWMKLVRRGCQRWEMRVHEDNTVIVVPMDVAARHGRAYVADNMRRWGVSLEYCKRLDNRGKSVSVYQPTRWHRHVPAVRGPWRTERTRPRKSKAEAEVDPRQGRLF